MVYAANGIALIFVLWGLLAHMEPQRQLPLSGKRMPATG
jgi:hypothetical protein